MITSLRILVIALVLSFGSIAHADPAMVAGKWTSTGSGQVEEDAEIRLEARFQKGGILKQDIVMGGQSKITLSIANFGGIGSYELSTENSATLVQDGEVYTTTAIHTGTVSITSFDAASGKLTATFSFKASSTSGEVAQIVNGVIEG